MSEKLKRFQKLFSEQLRVLLESTYTEKELGELGITPKDIGQSQYINWYHLKDALRMLHNPDTVVSAWGQEDKHCLASAKVGHTGTWG